MCLAVYFKTYVEDSVDKESNLVNFLQLVVEVDVGITMIRFQAEHNVDHKSAKAFSLPVKVGMLSVIL
jgi:hypothetical protein